ncbi:transcriptional regulator [Tepiditoga spiralis]|uniref:Transcriptional regulator n=1 Tax=Tepiditoga spiralis TaxID=2108365 RepID=A0A7G1G8P7_9BACT|nr:transcription repressor NadR [Tepiditoga spiralis]BBE31293.1 transcriptional regulator [Tepiditoga spiralis]
MDKEKRQKKIIEILSLKTKPISGTVLAKKFNVTRQVIVKDIAILKAQGILIRSNSRGYYINKSNKLIKSIAVKHSNELIEKELYTIVKCGGKILDVTIEHPVYGEITGIIDVETIEEINDFISKLKTSKPLSSINDGVHLHKIEVDNEKQFNCILNNLKELNILLN